MANMKKIAAFALVTALFAATASAQEMGKPDRIVLQSKAGSVMTSQGGEYQTAPVGKLLVENESMMLGEGATATVVYYYLDDAGKIDRECVEKYSGANTYVIDDRCTVVAGAWMAGGNSGGAGIIIGAGLIGAAIINGMGDEPVGPLSTGPNGTIRHF